MTPTCFICGAPLERGGPATLPMCGETTLPARIWTCGRCPVTATLPEVACGGFLPPGEPYVVGSRPLIDVWPIPGETTSTYYADRDAENTCDSQ